MIKHGANLNAADDFDYLPLHTALDERRNDMIRILVENGANIFAQRPTRLAPVESVLRSHRMDEFKVMTYNKK